MSGGERAYRHVSSEEEDGEDDRRRSKSEKGNALQTSAPVCVWLTGTSSSVTASSSSSCIITAVTGLAVL
jgi:hypothetical protein